MRHCHDKIRMITLPCHEDVVRALRVGDRVALKGVIVTARDKAHKFLAEGGTCPVSLRDGGIFHCGPVVLNNKVTSAGPTTSMREEPYMADIIAKYGLRVVMGKGGMGTATLAACRTYGCVYIQAVGGAAALIAQGIKKVRNVYFLDEFGSTEAMWELEIDGIEGIVGMDTHGNSLYEEVAQRSALCRGNVT